MSQSPQETTSTQFIDIKGVTVTMPLTEYNRLQERAREGIDSVNAIKYKDARILQLSEEKAKQKSHIAAALERRGYKLVERNPTWFTILKISAKRKKKL